jgi:hypothetical protein
MAVWRENFFIAKNCDSESAQHTQLVACGLPQLHRADLVRSRSRGNACSAGVSIDMNRCSDNIFAHDARVDRLVVERHVSRALASACQHFLKPDTVFSDVLVYSGGSAFRFPSARSDKAISLLGGQHGQESEEGEEGEERSEEDCEEDPQGRQEEVTFA